jgi:vitamin B12/bleomycin/antimicrobial peptide transport system ATP-binding/permease protein
VHMAGPSNTGKSTLARLLANLAVPTSGAITGAAPENILLLPQRGYLPLGTLADAMAYPGAGSLDRAKDRTSLAHALDVVGLSRLTVRLDETDRWDQVLSAGERQRLIAARAVLARPHILVIDDALSALEGAAQRTLIQGLRREIPGLTILSLGQRTALPGTFDRTLELTRHEQDAMLPDIKIEVAH